MVRVVGRGMWREGALNVFFSEEYELVVYGEESG